VHVFVRASGQCVGAVIAPSPPSALAPASAGAILPKGPVDMAALLVGPQTPGYASTPRKAGDMASRAEPDPVDATGERRRSGGLGGGVIGAVRYVCARARARATPPPARSAGGMLSDPRLLDEVVWQACRDFVDATTAGAAPSPVAVDLTAAAERAAVTEGATLVLHYPIKVHAGRLGEGGGGGWGDAHRASRPAAPAFVQNSSRSVGARLSGEIARRTGMAGLPPNAITLHFHGVAGQSFGFACNKGERRSPTHSGGVATPPPTHHLPHTVQA
jgi:hypothetical protein